MKTYFMDWVVGSIISAVIFLAVYSIWTDPTIITDFTDRFKQDASTMESNQFKLDNTVASSVPQDPLVSKCNLAFKDCAYRLKAKYEGSLSMITSQKFEEGEEEEAKEFYADWAAIGQDYYYERQTEYPIVMFAAKIKGDYGQSGIALICSDGKLTTFSKTLALC